jgi:hypothetical protein
MIEEPNGAATPIPSGDGSGTPAPSSTPSATPPAAPPSTADTPFLDLNNGRQVYKTREEAIRAYTEAGNRIAELSPWEALAKEGFTPQQVQQYLDELAQVRADKAAEAARQAAAAGPQLSPEWKAHLEFLKSQGIFTTQDELKALRTQLEQVGNSIQGEHAARIEGARSSGEAILNGIIKDSGVQIDEAGSRRIADSIEDAIVRNSRDGNGNIIPNSPEDRFIRGDASERTRIIKENFDWFNKFGDAYAQRKTSTLVDQKAAAQAANSRSLPPNSSPVPTTPTPGKGFRDPNLNKSVQAVMEAELARRGGGGLS